MAREMKDSGVAWLGAIPANWKFDRVKHYYTTHKFVVGESADKYERRALTLNGVIKRPKEDSTGLQPDAFNRYQILKQDELVFKLIDLENVSTSRVGFSPYTGIVSPAYIVLKPNGQYFSGYENTIMRIIEVFRDFDADQAEVIATLYGAWNDFMIDKRNYTDDDIVDEVLNNWPPKKKRFPREMWLRAIQRMRELDIVPHGYGRHTIVKEVNSLG